MAVEMAGWQGKIRIFCVASSFFANEISQTCFIPQFADELKMKVSPAFKQATSEPHPLNSMDFCPTNCHINLMEVSYPKNTTSTGRSFSIRIGRKPSIIGLDPEQGAHECSSGIILVKTGVVFSVSSRQIQRNVALTIYFFSSS